MPNHVGIQKTVLEIVEQVYKMGLKYISTADITKQVKEIRPDIDNPYQKVRQALYQLQRETKYKRPRIQKHFDRRGKRKGWTPFVDNTEIDRK